MELNAMKEAIDRLTENQNLSALKSQQLINELIQELEQASSKLLTSERDSIRTILEDLKVKFNQVSPLSHLQDNQKELNLAFSNYTELLGNSFNPDISIANRNVETNYQAVNQLIVSHFYRQGMFELGDFFLNESSSSSSSETELIRSLFMEIHRILESLSNLEFEPALSWIVANRDVLRQNESTDLEFKLHRLQFVVILQNQNGIEESFEYAREFVTQFSADHKVEVKRLMSCLWWAGRMEKSPYSDLLSSSNFENFADELMREYCKVIGKSEKCPLITTVTAGVTNLPILLRLTNLLIGEGEGEGKKEDLETMIDLAGRVKPDKDLMFHLIFECSLCCGKGNRLNPPIWMPCGHVLCMVSVVRLWRNTGGEDDRPLKCPYCVSVSKLRNCKQLSFR
ncbi:protein RMD5 homolog [Impatiens glandulifera]|uniref:protein RMD5 homolog n=1 Tax=Impatiens glandulifera TaxID=253017 RepID=UPI001FB075D6|nr:protein RMD5 homolog [Impatiens glandulifera]